jgi:hypothetical protein
MLFRSLDSTSLARFEFHVAGLTALNAKTEVVPCSPALALVLHAAEAVLCGAYLAGGLAFAVGPGHTDVAQTPCVSPGAVGALTHQNGIDESGFGFRAWIFS